MRTPDALLWRYYNARILGVPNSSFAQGQFSVKPMVWPYFEAKNGLGQGALRPLS